jgi:hypothetical protein
LGCWGAEEDAALIWPIVAVSSFERTLIASSCSRVNALREGYRDIDILLACLLSQQLLKSGGQIHVASSFKEQLVRDWLTAKSLACIATVRGLELLFDWQKGHLFEANPILP